MSKQRRMRPHSAASQSTNWYLIGGIIGAGVVLLIILLIISVTNPLAAERTPTLDQRVNNLSDYCDANPDRCIALGAADASVKMVEISDYGCTHCKGFNETSGPILQRDYVETGKIRYYIFPFALSDTTAPSAEATLCAAEQGTDKIVQFHETLFALQDTADAHTTAGFASVAERVGLDAQAIVSCVEAGTYRDTVSLNRQAARQVDISATPSFFINGRLLQGNLPLSNFQQQIEADLAADS